MARYSARKKIIGVAGTILLIPVAAPSPPAGAALTLTVTSLFSSVTVNAVGEGTIHFACESGKFTANDIQATPTVNCSTVTAVKVVGDSAAQNVYGPNLDIAAFTSHPYLDAQTGAGNDSIVGTKQPDKIDAGADMDSVYLHLPTADTSVNLGSGTDTLNLSTDIATKVKAVSGSTNLAVTATTVSGTANHMIAGTEYLQIQGSKFNDEVDLSTIVNPTSITSLIVYGGDGNDRLTCAAVPCNMDGGNGNNELISHSGSVTAWSLSETDKITGHPSGSGWIYDTSSPHSGGRTYTGITSSYYSAVYSTAADTVGRIRPAGAGKVKRTLSLARNGEQLLPDDFATIGMFFSYVGQVTHRNIGDVVAVTTNVHFGGQLADTDILDITVPTGTWTESGNLDNLTIDPSDPSLGFVTAYNLSDYTVHGPWTNKNQGFAHRVHRDLMFELAKYSWRDETRDHLEEGHLTRSGVVNSLMNTDEYRGLDVDRVFVNYLRRPTDSGGRNYWIGALRDGRALWRFRAQLFGSNEYFNKAGGTNANYIEMAYRDVMGRSPDSAGKAYWVAKLDGGFDRGSAALQFINSPEARRFLVNDQFLRFLNRKATTAEQNTWSPQISTNDGEQRLIAYLAASNSYFNMD